MYGQHFGYAFIELVHKRDVERALRIIPTREIDGRYLRTEIARGRSDRQRVGSSRGDDVEDGGFCSSHDESASQMKRFQRRIWIGGLPFVHDDEMREFLAWFLEGYRMEAVDHMRPSTRRDFGFVFVDMIDADAAQEAVDKLNRWEMPWGVVSVRIARPKPD